MRGRARNRRWTAFFIIAALALAALVWLYTRPANADVGVPCLFHALTGLYCPGCGVTRGLHLLMHGHFYAAFRMNPMTMTFLPALLWIGFSEIVRWLTGRSLMDPLPGKWMIALVAMVVLFTVLRNLPAEPFLWLRPTIV